jgi:hypothetical protein
MGIINGTAPMKFTLRFEGTDEELIRIAIYQSEDSLDSNDLGDAMGYFIQETMHEGGELTCGMPGIQGIVQCGFDYDLFQWEGISETPVILPHS